MARLQTIGAAFLASLALAGAAAAQDATPLSSREVIGDWDLTITPAERRGFEINIDFDDDDLPLTVSGQANGRLGCVLRGDPAECRMERGRLIVVMPTRSGGARMIFTLTDRTRGGFSGTARIRVGLLPLPYGGTIGAVAMARRQPPA